MGEVRRETVDRSSEVAERVSDHARELQLKLIHDDAFRLESRSSRFSLAALAVGLVVPIALSAFGVVAIVESGVAFVSSLAIVLAVGVVAALLVAWLERSAQQMRKDASGAYDRLGDIWLAGMADRPGATAPRYSVVTGPLPAGSRRRTAPSVPKLPRSASKEICIRVQGDLTADDVVVLCDSIQRMYTVVLVIELAQARSKSGSADALDLGVIWERVYDLAPRSVLRVASAQFASPGNINLQGSGEPIEKLGEVIEKAYTRKEIKRAAKLANDAREVEVKRAEMEYEHDRQMNRVELGVAQLDAVRDAFGRLYGPEILESEPGRQLFREFIGSFAEFSSLGVAGKLELADTTVEPPRK